MDVDSRQVGVDALYDVEIVLDEPQMSPENDRERSDRDNRLKKLAERHVRHKLSETDSLDYYDHVKATTVLLGDSGFRFTVRVKATRKFREG